MGYHNGRWLLSARACTSSAQVAKWHARYARSTAVYSVLYCFGRSCFCDNCGRREYCLPNGRGPFVRETPRQGNVTLRLTGIRRDVVADVKKTLEAAFLGSVAAQSGDASHQTTHREIWHDFFATVPGYIWLQHLGRKVGCLVTSDKLQQRIRVYSPGSKASHLRSIEEHLAAKSEELDSSRHTQIIKCEPKSFRAVLSSGTLVKLQERLGDGKVSLNILEKSLVLNCSLHEAHVLARHFDLPLPRNPIISFPACPQCGDKTEDIILSCRHVSCKDCFDHQIRVAATDLTGNHFPLVCWHEGCGRSVTIVDLRKYASGTTIDALLKASFIGYVRSRPELYRNCRTPNCNSVYLHDSSYEIFICPTCLTQTCTNCHVEPHVGWTCADYDQHLQATRNNELLLNKYKAAAGTKTCPKCASLIEKVDGCDLLECSCCHAHLCWQCWTVHASIAEAYKHMRQDH